MIMGIVKVVPCAEHIGRIVHISLRITDVKISLRISNQLRDAGIRTRLVKTTSTAEQTPVGSNAQSMATAALERKVWFSDESRFLLQRADGRARVHRGRNEPTNCIHQVDELLEAVL